MASLAATPITPSICKIRAVSLATSAPGATVPRSTRQTPLWGRTVRRRATSSAKRVFPTPPAPVSVNNWARRSCSVTTSRSRARPINVVGGNGRPGARGSSATLTAPFSGAPTTTSFAFATCVAPGPPPALAATARPVQRGVVASESRSPRGVSPGVMDARTPRHRDCHEDLCAMACQCCSAKVLDDRRRPPAYWSV